MLVLSRQRDESICINVPPSSSDQLVTVMIVDIRGDKVRLGITANKSVIVHRSEVWEAIKRERASRPKNGEEND